MSVLHGREQSASCLPPSAFTTGQRAAGPHMIYGSLDGAQKGPGCCDKEKKSRFLPAENCTPVPARSLVTTTTDMSRLLTSSAVGIFMYTTY